MMTEVPTDLVVATAKFNYAVDYSNHKIEIPTDATVTCTDKGAWVTARVWVSKASIEEWL